MPINCSVSALIWKLFPVPEVTADTGMTVASVVDTAETLAELLPDFWAIATLVPSWVV